VKGTWRFLAATVLAVAAALALAASAAAAPWTPARLPGAAGKVYLLSASCPSTSFCVVTGTNNLIASSTNPTGGSGAWDFVYAGDGPWPNTDDWPTEEISGLQVQSVSCPSAKLCVAVMNKGNIYSSTNPAGPASAWKSIEVDGKGRNTHLFGISCPSVSLCVAVSGRRADEGKVFTSTDPTGGPDDWRAVEMTEPTEFRAISCPTTSLCVAVTDSGEIVASTEPRGDASAWRTIGAPGGPGSMHTISCLPILCLTGNQGGNLFTTRTPAGPLSAWKGFNGGATVQITGVSCLSSTQCIAVDNNGSVLTSTNPTGGSGAWSYTNLIPYAPPGKGETLEGNALFAASCPSSRLCVVSGARGQIFVNTNPFAPPPPAAKKRKRRKRYAKRPRAKIATIKLPFPEAVEEHRARVRIRFYSVGRARGFVCKFDHRRFRRCRSPKRYPVGIGKHIFRVRAIGAGGRRGPAAHEEIRIRKPVQVPRRGQV